MRTNTETSRLLSSIGKSAAVVALGALLIASAAVMTGTPQASKQKDASVPVRFTDIRKSAGITFVQDSTQTDEKYYLETMGTGVAWLDYDQDGLMDLFLVQSAATDIYQPPHPLRSALYHNNGDGTFTDVTEKAGVAGAGHYGQGVAVGDFDNDGYPDLYVTGYGSAILYHNNRDGTFTDVTSKAGVADQGQWSTSAGWFDHDKDGYLDLLVTNYIDWSRSGIGNKFILLSGVSMKFLDFDNDGWPDILQANGAMVDNVELYHSEVTYKEPLLMLRNVGKGQFEKVSESLGPDFTRPIAGRGLATADFDNDGDIDIAVNVRGDYPMILRNDGGNANHWLEVFLIGTPSNRDGIGSSLKLVSEGFVEVEQAKGGTSYMSASDPRIHFGLGKRNLVDSLEVSWPSGRVDRLTNVPVDQIIAVKEGTGIVARLFPKLHNKTP